MLRQKADYSKSRSSPAKLPQASDEANEVEIDLCFFRDDWWKNQLQITGKTIGRKLNMFPPVSSLSQLCKCYCSEIQCIEEKASQLVLETCYSSGKWGINISFQVVNPPPQPLPFHRVLRRLRMLNSSCVTLSSFLDLSVLHFHHLSIRILTLQFCEDSRQFIYVSLEAHMVKNLPAL